MMCTNINQDIMCTNINHDIIRLSIIELKIRSIYSFISYMTSLIILYENMHHCTSATGGSKITMSSKMTCLGSRNTAASRSLDRWKHVTKTHVLFASQRGN